VRAWGACWHAVFSVCVGLIPLNGWKGGTLPEMKLPVIRVMSAQLTLLIVFVFVLSFRAT
jgi:formate hydrogenlyase subunit 3/multisubunit Na+/H+ antiporter MnhD subunit